MAAPSHSYAAAGTYTVSLTVTGPGGSNTQTRSNYVTVTAAAPVAQFTGSPTSGRRTVDGELQQHLDGQHHQLRLDFGDGGSSTVAAPSHSYAAAGNYTVSLTVTGPGGSNTQTRSNYVTVDRGGTGRAVHRQSRRPATPVDGELQQHLDGHHHQLRLGLRRWRQQHRRRAQPQLCGGRHLHGEPHRHRAGRQQHPDPQQLRDGHRGGTGRAVHRQSRRPDVAR